MPRGDLFPEIGPYETGYLPLSDGHVMYWEQVGNPRGKPVLFLHGGPGAGAGAVHRRFFDPNIWRVIIFDQRGAGRSKPLGSLVANTTPHLVEDIEALRKFLRLEQLLLFGGSWGSTLALAYAQAYPEAVMGAVLRGIFLGRPAEVRSEIFKVGAVVAVRRLLGFDAGIGLCAGLSRSGDGCCIARDFSGPPGRGPIGNF